MKSMFQRRLSSSYVFFGAQLLVATVVLVYFFLSPLTLKRNAVTKLRSQRTIENPAPIFINPVPNEGVLSNMSTVDLIKFYHSYVVSPQVTCRAVTRMGKLLDGGWELCEDPEYRPIPGSCLVYSYGIGDDFSFDDDMANYGCEVHSFDPTMFESKDYARSTHVHFHPRGLGGSDRQVLIPKNKRLINAHVDTIATHRRMFNHQPHTTRLDVVKIDVEGFELESLMTSLDDGSLADTRQLIFETHLMHGGMSEPVQDAYIKYLLLLRKVYAKGYRIYATHRNYMFSRFFSTADKKYHAFCHEIHTVNISNKNNTAVFKNVLQ